MGNHLKKYTSLEKLRALFLVSATLEIEYATQSESGVILDATSYFNRPVKLLYIHILIYLYVNRSANRFFALVHPNRRNTGKKDVTIHVTYRYVKSEAD